MVQLLVMVSAIVDNDDFQKKKKFFLCPSIDRSGAYSFWPICLSVRPFVVFFVGKNFHVGHIF